MLKKGVIVPLLCAVAAAGVSVACALRFQSRYFQQLDCMTSASTACADQTARAMAGWGVLAAVFAFLATACTVFALLRLRRSRA